MQPGQGSDLALAYLLPNPTDCPDFAYAPPVSTSRHVDVVTLDHSTVLALSRTELIRFHIDETPERLPLPADENGTAIVMSDAGRVWVATSSAVRPFDPATGRYGPTEFPLPTGAAVIGLMVREVDPEPEVWIFTEAAQLFVRRGEATGFELEYEFSDTLVRLEELGTRTSAPTRFVPLEGEDFLLAGQDVSLVLERVAGRFRLLGPRAQSIGYGGALRRPDGTVLLTESLTGTVYLYDRGALDAVSVRTTGINGLAVLDEERFVFVTSAGSVGVLFPDQRSCPLDPTPVWSNLRSIARLGDAYVVAGGHPAAEHGFGVLRLGAP
jgi:hypothetical protein